MGAECARAPAATHAYKQPLAQNSKTRTRARSSSNQRKAPPHLARAAPRDAAEEHHEAVLVAREHLVELLLRKDHGDLALDGLSTMFDEALLICCVVVGLDRGFWGFGTALASASLSAACLVGRSAGRPAGGAARARLPLRTAAGGAHRHTIPFADPPPLPSRTSRMLPPSASPTTSSAPGRSSVEPSRPLSHASIAARSRTRSLNISRNSPNSIWPLASTSYCCFLFVVVRAWLCVVCWSCCLRESLFLLFVLLRCCDCRQWQCTLQRASAAAHARSTPQLHNATATTTSITHRSS